ncbi:DUF948 domain-containing protein [Paenibacillus contaminans]|nr:DUF948 domain-containing protein [Paenibacillus contaminans]
MLVLQIAIGIIAVSVAVLAGYTIMLLIGAKSAIREAELTLSELRSELKRIGGEAEPLMRSACKLTESMNERAAAFDPVLGAVRQAGEAMRSASGSFRKLSDAFCDTAEDVSETLCAKRSQSRETADLAGLAIDMWDNVRKLRSKRG